MVHLSLCTAYRTNQQESEAGNTIIGPDWPYEQLKTLSDSVKGAGVCVVDGGNALVELNVLRGRGCAQVG